MSWRRPLVGLHGGWGAGGTKNINSSMERKTHYPIPSVSALDTPNTPEKGVPKNPTPSRRKRPCGAEIKRRRKARQAAEAQASSTACEHSKFMLKINTSLPPSKDTVQLKPQCEGQTLLKDSGQCVKRPKITVNTLHRIPPQKWPCEHSKLSTSYSQAANTNLRVTIVNRLDELGRLTAEQANNVESTLLDALDNELFNLTNSGSTPPTFGGMDYAGQMLRVTCDNSRSLEWVSTQLESIKIDGVDLKIVRMEDPPTAMQVSLWIPGKPDKKNIVFGRLEAQNPDLKINNWCCFHTASKEEPLGQLFVMEVDDEDAAKLKSKGGKLKYLFNTLQAKVTIAPDKEKVLSTEPLSSGDGGRVCVN